MRFELKSPENIGNDRPNNFSQSLHNRALDLKEKLSRCLSSQILRRWCAFEWFYSAIDYPWFAKREFCRVLKSCWLRPYSEVDTLSQLFLHEEKEKLEQYRESVRTHYTDLRSSKKDELPADLAQPPIVESRSQDTGQQIYMLRRQSLASDKLHEHKLNGLSNDWKSGGHVKLPPSENQENADGTSHISPPAYPMNTLLKHAKTVMEDLKEGAGVEVYQFPLDVCQVIYINKVKLKLETECENLFLGLMPMVIQQVALSTLDVFLSRNPPSARKKVWIENVRVDMLMGCLEKLGCKGYKGFGVAQISSCLDKGVRDKNVFGLIKSALSTPVRNQEKKEKEEPRTMKKKKKKKKRD
ncbi:hypothetical protein IFM89_034245 [Coptis chinensis]|uniref:DIRP domain-containing protein n=1 Tax=Coptis chinensis TaxID=261450 RepID=A0A835LGF8_9MAGN|nr:hypothetical protein IFM89_034245 [Coptis chinensis]